MSCGSTRISDDNENREVLTNKSKINSNNPLNTNNEGNIKKRNKHIFSRGKSLLIKREEHQP